jgi:hypothetical protein
MIDFHFPSSNHKTNPSVEEAGVEFIDANGGGPGVRLRDSKS